MAVFPLFVDLKGKKCVVIGGGNVATRKIKTLVQFDADITVISPDLSEVVQELQCQGSITAIKKKYSSDDIEGAFLVVAATNDPVVNTMVYNDAIRNNIFVNVADSPEKCTFVFPSVVKRDDLVIGVSTSGSYPALSKKVREKLDEMFPRDYGDMLKILAWSRKRAEVEIHNPERRREMLNKILDEVLFYKGVAREKLLSERIEIIFEEYKNEENN